MVQTFDGGYAIAGYTNSWGASYADFWLVKTDWDGDMQWSRAYGGTNWDGLASMVQTSDGGYTLAGITEPFLAGTSDAWLVKTDAAGNMQWNQTYGGTNDDSAECIIQTDDGGYAIAGYTKSFGAGDADLWLIKTNSTGSMQWSRTYGGASGDVAYALIQTMDGGYALAGRTYSFGAGSLDVWLVKTDSNGNMEWNKTYGGTSSDSARSLIQTIEGGYAIAGSTGSFGFYGFDFWLIKIDATGSTEWNQTYNEKGWSQDDANSLVQAEDGGYAIAGMTESWNPEDYGDWGMWLVKTDANGNVQWDETYGYATATKSLIQTVDGGYAMVGQWLGVSTGTYDFGLVKTEAESGLVRTDSTADTITLYRGATDAYWNYVRVCIWKIKDTP